jgi:hypothetical protein
MLAGSEPLAALSCPPDMAEDGRRTVVASAGVNRVVGIASGGRRSRPLPKKLPGWSARVSAQWKLRKKLPVLGRDATTAVIAPVHRLQAQFSQNAIPDSYL